MLLHRLVIRLQYAARTLPVLGIVLLLFGEWLWSVAAFGGERDERGHARPHRN